MSNLKIQFEETDKELFSGLNKINHCIDVATAKITTPCRITTMTILVSLDQRISLDKINQTNLVEIVNTSSTCKCEMGMCKTFHNCIIFKCTSATDNIKVTIKVFSNGNLHLTGVKSVSMAMDYGSLFCSCLGQLFGQQIHMKTFTIQLVNATCKLVIGAENVISLSAFKDVIGESAQDVQCFYNNDVHAGLRMKLPYLGHTSTVILFATGSVLFNAFLSGNELVNAYNFVTSYFNRYESSILKPKLIKDGLKYDDEFDYNQYI